jgi:hypothetical protein
MDFVFPLIVRKKTEEKEEKTTLQDGMREPGRREVQNTQERRSIWLLFKHIQAKGETTPKDELAR